MRERQARTRALGCTVRWAQALKQEARERRKRERDAEITRRAAEGQSQRQIACETGIPQKTVSNVIRREPERKPSEMVHPSWSPADIPAPRAPEPSRKPPSAPDPDTARAFSLSAEHDQVELGGVVRGTDSVPLDPNQR